MRHRIAALFAVVLLAGSVALAQDAKPSTPAEKLSKKPVTITGTVNSDGSTLVADKDTRTYKVINPDFLKENAGQHVRVSARVNKENNEILISSVMVQDAATMTANKGDAAFRR